MTHLGRDSSTTRGYFYRARRLHAFNSRRAGESTGGNCQLPKQTVAILRSRERITGNPEVEARET